MFDGKINGAVLEKKYKGMEISVKVLEVGFEYNSKYYKTFSAVACAITGQHISGYHSLVYERNY